MRYYTSTKTETVMLHTYTYTSSRIKSLSLGPRFQAEAARRGKGKDHGLRRGGKPDFSHPPPTHTTWQSHEEARVVYGVNAINSWLVESGKSPQEQEPVSTFHCVVSIEVKLNCLLVDLWPGAKPHPNNAMHSRPSTVVNSNHRST